VQLPARPHGHHGSQTVPKHAAVCKQRVLQAPDEGLLEAAAEQAYAECYLAVLNPQSMGFEESARLMFTPPTLEEYAASFKFGHS
jgi:hypothetical protein